VNPFDASVQHQVGKLIDRPENGFQNIFFSHLLTEFGLRTIARKQGDVKICTKIERSRDHW
jgi:hypothetical protein